ncbi:hypothetical protein NF865_06585 [Thermococcus aggregans]|uniref:Uncharacterized protein n=1 Tax=Thermococcus aggregans TaxID=110163 RepID=A0A9E7MWF4_THEAG|nr:hypothetical protein [Thermococcus aggregans]USS40011.1 hypothetical protein NF865_06585 [Thermococcus aggregans]
MRTKEIALMGLLLSLSLVLEISPLKVPTQWGMTIDLVAVPIVVIYVLLGFWSSVTALMLLFVGLSLISSATWLGATMKYFATLSVIIGLEIAKKLTTFDFKQHEKRDLVIFLLVAYLAGIAIRIPAMVAMNYYFAMPFYFGISREQVIPMIEELFHIPFWLVIGIPNAIQSAVDVVVGVLVSLPVIRALPHIIE